MRCTRILLTAALVIALAAGCSDRNSRTFINQPTPGRYGLTGHVRLEGDQMDVFAQFVGPLVVRDASGVRVRLQRPDGTTDSVVTQNGSFEFRADAPGYYRASCWVVPTDTLATSSVTLASSDVVFPDTLVMSSAVDLITAPNPFSNPDGIAVYFSPTFNQRVRSSVLTLAGLEVRSFSDSVVAGQNQGHLHWVGEDNQAGLVPNAMYWMVVRVDGAPIYDLVVKQ